MGAVVGASIGAISNATFYRALVEDNEPLTSTLVAGFISVILAFIAMLLLSFCSWAMALA